MDHTNGRNEGLWENMNTPIDEILQSIVGNDEEESRIISLNELFSESTDNDNDKNSHYFKRTNNSIQNSNSTINTTNSNQINSPSYLEYSSQELTLDDNHRPYAVTNSNPIPISSIPPNLTHQTLPKILPSNQKPETVYVDENFSAENNLENATQQTVPSEIFRNQEPVNHSCEKNESAGYTFIIKVQIPTKTNQSQGDRPKVLVSSINPQNLSSESQQALCSTPNENNLNNCQDAKIFKPRKRNHPSTKRKRNSSNATNDISSNKISRLEKYNKQSQPFIGRDKREKNKIKLCPICGDTASSHMHYGGRCCAGCRAFFKRSVVKQSRITGFRYFCKCPEDCDKYQKLLCNIVKEDRNICKYCRYKRCRDVAGLVQKWVPSAFKDVEDNKKKKQVCRRKNDTNNEQAAAKERNIITRRDRYNLSETQEMIDNMTLRYQDSYLENKMLVETFQSIMQFCDPNIPESCRKLFDHFSSLEMHHLANQFEEFKQLTPETQVALLEENAQPFSKICFLKLMIDSVMKEKIHVHNLTSIYLKLFHSKGSRKKQLTNSSKSSINRFISQMIEMAKQFQEILMFFLPIVLFSPYGIDEFPSQQNMIIEFQLKYIQQLERIILFDKNGDENIGAVNFAIANDLILLVREI